MEMILATKSGTPIIGQIADRNGMDHEWYLQGAGMVFGIQNIGLCDYYVQYSDLSFYDSSADQTAEIL